MILAYLSDIEGYTAKYCVNIDKPKLQCNGKCHLTKELAKENKKKDTERTQNFPTINLYFVSESQETEPLLFEQLDTENNFYYNANLTDRNPAPLSPPPLV